jgi:hypothetical protein
MEGKDTNDLIVASLGLLQNLGVLVVGAAVAWKAYQYLM